MITANQPASDNKAPRHAPTGPYQPNRVETWHVLTDEQLSAAAALARARGPGRYTVKEIYGDEWPSMRRARRFGVLFKRAVRDGAVPGVTWVGRKSNRSQLYEVGATAGT